MSKASDDFPDPDRPVITVRLSRGSARSIFLRLCSLAPVTRISLSIAQIKREGWSAIVLLPHVVCDGKSDLIIESPKIYRRSLCEYNFVFCRPTCFEVETGGDPAAAVIIYFLIVAAG